MFIDVLEKELKQRNLTLNKLAKGAGVSQASTVRWKQGSVPNSDALIKICKYLNVSADYLLGLELETKDLLSPQERILLEQFRRIEDDAGRKLVLELTQREASRYEPPQEQEKLYSSKTG